MVEQLDVEQVACLRQLGGDAQVVAGWRRIAGRVIVDDDDGRGTGAHRITEHLTDADG